MAGSAKKLHIFCLLSLFSLAESIQLIIALNYDVIYLQTVGFMLAIVTSYLLILRIYTCRSDVMHALSHEFFTYVWLS